MNDIEFAARISKRIGEMYRDAKNCSVTRPAHTLSLTRALASLCCDELARHHQGRSPLPPGLEEKIESLASLRLVNHLDREILHALRIGGNKGVHPEKFVISDTEYMAMASDALVKVLKLLELVFQTKKGGAALPKYEICPAVEGDLEALSYQAIFENRPESQYQIGTLLKKRALLERNRDERDATGGASEAVAGGACDALNAQALYWLCQASDAGHPPAQYDYGVALMNGEKGPESKRAGHDLIWSACRAGHIDALADAGAELMNGSEWRAINYEEARGYLEKAAEHDHPGALSDLGVMYNKGLGVPADPVRAYALTLKAARAGYPLSQYNAAVLLEHGDGVERNFNAALEWMMKASEGGIPHAELSIARRMAAGPHSENWFDETEKLFLKAASRLNAAKFELAMFYYRHGDGARHLLEAAGLVQQCYEIAVDEQDEQLQRQSHGIAPTIVQSMVRKIGSMTDEDQKSAILTRFLFDAHGHPYSNRSERVARFVSANLELAEIKDSGLAAERLLWDEITSGFSVSIEGYLRAPVQTVSTLQSSQPKAGRNAPCPCGSTRKFKACCGQLESDPSLNDLWSNVVR